jgi:hypothetical protein
MAKAGAADKASSAQQAATQSLFQNDALHLTFCVVGVVGSLLMYGVLQVRLGEHRRCGWGGFRRVRCLADVRAACLALVLLLLLLLLRINTQERIMTMPYGLGAEGEVFKYSLFLVFCNRLFAAAIAAVTLVVRADQAGSG